MQPLTILLIGMLWFATAESASGVSGFQPEQVLGHVAEMSPISQVQWLKDIEARYDRVNHRLLGPQEAARQRAEIARLLRQERVPLPVIIGLLRELNRREETVLDRLVRQYLLQAHSSFKQQPDEFTRRTNAWYRVFDSWQKAGRPFSKQGEVVAWLESALHPSMLGRIRQLPPLPNYEDSATTNGVIVHRQSPDSSTTNSRRSFPVGTTQTPEAVASSPLPVEQTPPNNLLDRPATSVAEMESDGTPTDKLSSMAHKESLLELPFAPRIIGKSSFPRQTAATWFATEPSRDVVFRECMLPKTQPQNQVIVPPPSMPSSLIVSDSSERDDAMRASHVTDRFPLYLSKSPVGTRVMFESPRSVSPPPPIATDLSPVVLPKASKSQWEQALPPEQRNDLVMQEPIAGGTGPPYHGDFAASSHNAIDRSLQVQWLRPVEQWAMNPNGWTEPPSEMGLNLSDLTACIAGNNLALRAIEAELDEQPRWNVEQLRPIVARLKLLVALHCDLALLRDIVNGDARARLGRLESPRLAISRLGARIAESRIYSVGPEFSGTNAQRQAEIKQLDELSRQLAQLTPPQ